MDQRLDNQETEQEHNQETKPYRYNYAHQIQTQLRKQQCPTLQTKSVKLALRAAKVLDNSTFPLRFPVCCSHTGKDLTAWNEYLDLLVAILQQQLLREVRHFWQKNLYHAPKPMDRINYQEWHALGNRDDYQDYLEERLTFFKSLA